VGWVRDGVHFTSALSLNSCMYTYRGYKVGPSQKILTKKIVGPAWIFSQYVSANLGHV
jgi:hypothetical protein